MSPQLSENSCLSGDVFPLNKVLSLVSTTKYMKFECRIGIWRCDWRSISLFMSYISNSARCKYVWMDTACWNNLPLCISKLAPIKLQVPVNYLFPYELSFNYVTFILKKSIKYFWPKLHTFFVMSVRILPVHVDQPTVKQYDSLLELVA